MSAKQTARTGSIRISHRSSSYSDPHQAIAGSLEAVGYYPQTLFCDARGQRTIVHGGSYLTAAALERDVRR